MGLIGKKYFMDKENFTMKSQKKHSFVKGCAIALSSILAIAAPAMALGNVFARSSSDTSANTAAVVDYELVDDIQDSAILHCWNWSYKTIEEHLQLIAECGYSAVQTSPATQPKDYTYDGEVGMEVGIPGIGGSGNWWKLYQPVTESVCDNGETWLGTKEELQSLCEKAESYGIKVIVDVVANHMGNITGWQNSLDDVSPQVGEYWNEDMLTDESYWHINDLQVWMSDGREHFTQGTMGMPDLNTADKRVQQYIADYLVELIDCGVDGFRFDAAKHIETPDDDPAYASDFWPTVLGIAESHYTEVTGDDLYVYGEVLNTVGDNFSIDSYTKYMPVTDNSAGNHLFEAYRNNNIGSLNLNYAADKTVLWAESHDTYMNEASRYGSDKSIMRAWAMVANKDNAAALFFVRPYYSSETLENDTDGAFKSNLQNTLEPAIMGECETYVWATNEVAAINHFNNRFVNYSDNMGSDGNVAYCVRGQGIILVNFNGAGNISMSSHGLADGVYTDEVSGNTFTVSGGVISGYIESEYGIAVVYQNVMPNPGQDYNVRVNASVGSGTTFYTDSLEVTVTASYADTAEYVASTGEKGTFTGSATINIGAGLSAGETVTLTVKASNSSGSVEKTFTYTKAEYNLDNCIFYKNTNGWSSVTTYMWNDTGATVKSNTNWPGEAMFECDSANNIYAIAVDPDAGYNKIIFSNNGASQTADLDIKGIGYCYDAATGTWYQYKNQPIEEKTPSISSTVASSVITGETKVTYTVTNATSATYSIDGGAEVAFTGSVTLSVGKDLAEGAVEKVVISAVNGSKSKTETYTYEMDYTQPTVAASKGSQTTTDDSLTVTFTAKGAKSATITVNGKAESFTGSVTKTFTEDATVVVKAVNGTKNATATFEYKFKKVSDTVEVFFDVTQCGWFGNDYAVAAVKFNNQSKFTACETETVNGKTYYKAEVPDGATSLELCRMLPSGATYNTVKISLADGKNLWTAYSGLNGGNWTKDASLGEGYTEDPIENTITVYFENNYRWDGTIRAYYWGSSAESVNWPGVEMTYVKTNSSGNAVYKITIPSDIVGLIFTNGSAQTIDITTNLKNNAEFCISGNSGSKYNVSAN